MTNEAWFEEYLAAWNARDGKRVVEFMTDDAVFEDLALGQRHEGREAIIGFVEGMTGVSSDYHLELVSAFATDSNYAWEWELSGTHDGDAGGLPPTGKTFRIRGGSVGALRDGKIERNRDYWNMADFLTQVGILPAPA